jgi:hypothetical protein
MQTKQKNRQGWPVLREAVAMNLTTLYHKPGRTGKLEVVSLRFSDAYLPGKETSDDTTS